MYSVLFGKIFCHRETEHLPTCVCPWDLLGQYYGVHVRRRFLVWSLRHSLLLALCIKGAGKEKGMHYFYYCRMSLSKHCFSSSGIIDESLTSCLCWCGCMRKSVIGSLSSEGPFILFHTWEFHTHSSPSVICHHTILLCVLVYHEAEEWGRFLGSCFKTPCLQKHRAAWFGKMSWIHRKSAHITSVSYFGISVLSPKHPCLCPVMVQNGVNHSF